LRAVEFVAGEREQIHRQLLHIERQAPGGLHGVGVEQRALLAGNVPQCRNGLQRAHLALAVNDRDQDSIGLQGRFQIRWSHAPAAIHGQARHLPAPALQQLGRARHGWVLDAGNNGVLRLPVLARHTHQRQVICLGPAGCERDGLGSLGVEQRGHLPAGQLQLGSGPLAPGVRASRVAPLPGQDRLHFGDRLGARRRCRAVVEIDLHADAAGGACLHLTR